VSEVAAQHERLTLKYYDSIKAFSGDENRRADFTVQKNRVHIGVGNTSWEQNWKAISKLFRPRSGD
jgi:hypothetical protein